MVPEDQAVTQRQVQAAYGYGFPVRSVFCGMSRHDVADWIAHELEQRRQKQNSSSEEEQVMQPVTGTTTS